VIVSPLRLRTHPPQVPSVVVALRIVHAGLPAHAQNRLAPHVGLIHLALPPPGLALDAQLCPKLQ